MNPKSKSEGHRVKQALSVITPSFIDKAVEEANQGSSDFDSFTYTNTEMIVDLEKIIRDNFYTLKEIGVRVLPEVLLDDYSL